jgi:hypothetical protein
VLSWEHHSVPGAGGPARVVHERHAPVRMVLQNNYEAMARVGDMACMADQEWQSKDLGSDPLLHTDYRIHLPQ